MATILECPTCRRSLSVPEEMLGTRVRCPECGVAFQPGQRTAEEEAPPPDPPVAPHAVTAAAPGPPGGPAGGAEQRACPACGELISAAAVRCPYCRQDFFEEDDRPWERPYGARVRRDSLPHRGTLILIFGILGFVLGAFIGLGFSIAAWVMGQYDLRRMDAGEMDPAGRSLTQAGRICGIIGTIFQSLMAVMSVVMSGFMIYMTSAMPPATMRAAPAPAVPVNPAKPPPAQPPGGR
jgi:predicted RNA-binding Zn-ribbon protein involved in translation (DUF1610 family)